MKTVIRNIFTGLILISLLSLPIVAQDAPPPTSAPDLKEEALPATAETEAPEMTEEAEKAIDLQHILYRFHPRKLHSSGWLVLGNSRVQAEQNKLLVQADMDFSNYKP